MTTIEKRLEEFVQRSSQLPVPGSGETWRRFTALAEQASIDLSLGRLCEGHADALAILAEAGRKPADGATYGVWASRGKSARTVAERDAGGWRLSGTKEFCSGSGIIDRALVVADTSDGCLLFDIAVDTNVVTVLPDSWPSVGMADSRSDTLEFGGPRISNDAVVGPLEFYVHRTGFWFGAIGVAACWYGGAVGIVNELIKSLDSEPNDFVLADLGDCIGALETMRVALRCAAHAIDRDPRDEGGQAHFRAMVARHVVHAGALTVLEHASSAGGARSLCLNGEQSQRVADLFVYVAQHHGRADAMEMGRIVAKARSWS